MKARPLKAAVNISLAVITCMPDGAFPKSFRFYLSQPSGNDPLKVFGNGRQNLDGEFGED